MVELFRYGGMTNDRIMDIIKRIMTAASLAIACTGAAFAAGQETARISGSVFGKTSDEPVAWATVALMGRDSTIVSGAACDENGAYAFQAVPGSYTMMVSMLGYTDYSGEVTLRAGDNVMAPVFLEEDAGVLSGAVLTERVKLVEMKMDKLVMNVSQSAFAQGSNALELIRKAPGVTIDKDGNIKLNGKSVSVWIDGRPSYADGKTLEILLRSTNGESIERFEIMEHPSAKYDASGQGGIIDIRTKRNMLSGLNGSAGLSGGGMHFGDISETPWSESLWANISYRGRRTNTFLNVSEGIENAGIKVVNDLQLPSVQLRQVGTSVLMDSDRNFHAKFGNDWFIDDRNTLGFIVYVPGGQSVLKSKSSVMEQWIAGEKYSTENSVIDNFSRSRQYNANLNYTRVIDEARSSELTVNLDWYRNNGYDCNRQDNVTDLLSGGTGLLSGENIETDRIYGIYSAKADYQTVIGGQYMLEAGVKWAFSDTDNHTEERTSDMPEMTTDFRYREHVGAAYASFAGSFGKFSAKAGLRGEYTNSLGDWISAGDRTSRSYFDIFPTLFIGYTAGGKTMISASYSRRINRPGYRRLNPTRTYMDSRTFFVGNPDILPEYNDNLNLSVNYGQFLSVSAGFSNTRNAMTQIPSYTDDGLQYYTWGNYGGNNIGFAGVGVSALPLGEHLQWTLNLNGLYVKTWNDTPKSAVKSLSCTAYTAFSLLLPKDWKIELDGQGTTSMRIANFKTYPYFMSGLAVKKSLMDNRLSLSLSCNDIFRTFRNDVDVIDDAGNGITTMAQRPYEQKVLLNLSWSFGKAGQTRQRKVGNLEEMSRASASSGLN